MKLHELFTSLSYGPLSNMAIGGDGSGVIPDEHVAKMLTFVNKGLIALYGKFAISQKELVVRAYDNKTLYPLKKIYADSDPTVVSQKYIMDTVQEPFTEDIIKILEVYDEASFVIPLNDTTDPNSLFTPDPTTLQIHIPATGDAYFLVYQAKHKPLVYGDLDQEVVLPELLQEALEAHITYQIFSPMNGQEHANKAAEQLARYEMICNDITERDLLLTSDPQNHGKLFDRGFV